MKKKNNKKFAAPTCTNDHTIYTFPLIVFSIKLDCAAVAFFKCIIIAIIMIHATSIIIRILKMHLLYF